MREENIQEMKNHGLHEQMGATSQKEGGKGKEGGNSYMNVVRLGKRRLI